MIECVVSQGSRELTFAQPRRFIFTLTATFGDGTKDVRQVSVVLTYAR